MLRTRLLSNCRRRVGSPKNRWDRSRLYLQALEDRTVPATFTVSSTADGVVTAAGQLPGSLRQAIFDANALAGDDTIDFSALFSTSQTITLNTTAANLVISGGLNIIGPGVGNLTIDGTGTAAATRRIFNISATGTPTVTISGMTITGGNTSAGNNGGAILVADESLVLNNVVITKNTAGTSGGAIAVTATNVNVSISNSTISTNTGSSTATTGAGGGAIFIPAAIKATVTINNSTFSGNKALGTGGAVLGSATTTTSVTLNVTGSTFTGNSATGAGGCFNLSGASGTNNSTITINTSTFSGNTATTTGGVANFNNSGSSTITNSSFTSNSATGSGGVFLMNTIHQGTISDCTFTTNTTASEGAIINEGSAGTSVQWSNCTFTNNAANSAVGRGGVALMGSGVSATFTNCTFTGNSSSGDRGGVFYTGAVTLALNTCNFSNNTTTGHGGVLATSTTTGATNYTISDCTFTMNSAVGSSTVAPAGIGGAISAVNQCQFTITNSIFSKNTAKNAGGAIGIGSTVTTATSMNVTGSTFSDNTAGTVGGAISTVAGPLNAVMQIDGSTFNNNIAGSNGGAISQGWTTGSTFNVLNSTFSKNKASSAGGAIQTVSTSPSVVISNSKFSDNTATTTGGAINLASATTVTVNSASRFERNLSSTTGGAIHTASTLDGTFQDSTFIENVGTTGGGALSIASTSTVSVNNCLIADNIGSAGGAIRFAGTTLSSTITLTTISGNTATSASGGGIYSTTTTASTLMTINSSSIINNTAKAGGGGIRVAGTSVLINNSTLSGNVSQGDTSVTGGGGLLQASVTFTGSITLNNTTVTNNTATGASAFGGGIFSADTNTADGTITLNSTIVAGNFNPSNPAKNQDMGFAAVRTILADRILIGAANSSFNFTGSANVDPALIGTELSPVDPGLYGLWDNGGTGSPLTHALKANSPAIDQGNDGTLLGVDQRGFARTVDEAPANAFGGDGTDLGSTEGPVLHPVPNSFSFDNLINIDNAGDTAFDLTVVYQDNLAVNHLSIGLSDVAMYRGSSTTPISPTSFITTPSAGSVTVTYTFTPPGGSWNLPDNDVYTIKMLANEVNDGNVSNTVLPGTFGRVIVSVPNVYTVDSISDELDADYTAGDFTLREAIFRANTESPDNQDYIRFKSSIWGKTIQLASEIVISDSVVIDGPGSGLITISGNAVTRLFNFAIPGGGVESIIDDVTLTGGKVTGAGGVILLNDESLVLTSVIVTGNEASTTGGAIDMTTGALTINNCQFTNNKSTTSTGGAINATTGNVTVGSSTVSNNTASSSGGAISGTTGVVSITNSTFANNTSGGSGGAIRVTTGGANITGSTLTGNTAASTGGAVYLSTGATLNVTNSQLTNNKAGSNGGAIRGNTGTFTISSSSLSGNTSGGTTGGGGLYTNAVTLSISDSTISNNTSAAAGGGIRATGTTTITNTTVSGNQSATSGGGIYASSGTLNLTASTVSNNRSLGVGGGGIGATTGTITLLNSTISGNQSSFGATYGGGIRMSGAGTLKVFNSTITRNTAPLGGGIGLGSTTVTVNLESAIVAQNTGGVDPDIFEFSSDTVTLVSITGTNNLIGSFTDSQVNFSNPGGNPLVGTLLSPVDAMLTPLGFYLGTMQTHGPLTGSPAINAGTQVSNPGVTTDQRGQARNDGGGLDIGSFEGEFKAPYATANLSDVTTAGGTNYIASVVYHDSTGVDTNTINGSEVTLTRTGLSPISPFSFLVTPGVGSVTVAYTFQAPVGAGTWDYTDNGTFTLSLLGNKVKDGSGNAAFANVIDTFDVDIAKTYLVDKYDVDIDDGLYGAGQLTLREAISRAGIENPGHNNIITFSSSTVALDGEIAITNPLTIIGNGQGVTVIQGTIAASATGRIFNINIPGGSKVVNISNLTLQGGNLSTGNGGAILSDDEVLIIDNVTFDANKALGGTGGAIATTLAGASLTVTDSIFSNNSASSTGGAINTAGLATLTISNSSFTNNTSTGSTGGAVNTASTVTLNVSDSVFSGNSATASIGGAWSIASTTIGSLTNTQVTNNTAGPSSAGGGFRILGTSTLTFDRCLVSGNTAGTLGGGIYLSATLGEITIQNSSIINNTAGTGGGGIRMLNQNLTIINTTISGNVAKGDTSVTGGGGILGSSTAFTNALKIYNSTIFNNSATGATLAKGGGIFMNDSVTTDGTILLSSTIVAGNINTSGLAPDISAGGTLPRPITIDSSLVGNIDGTGTFTIGGTYNAALVGNGFTVDPGLLTLSNIYGGGVFVNAPAPGSLALNGGLNALSLSLDQRGIGFPREDGTIDIGAVEGPFLNPVASADLSDLLANAGVYQAVVTYTDETKIDTTEFGKSDVALFRNGVGSPIAPTAFSVMSIDAKTAKVTYDFKAPGDSLWSYEDGDSYTLRLFANEVYDEDTPTKHSAFAGDLDSFQVAIPTIFVVDNAGNGDDSNFGPGQFTLREALRLANRFQFTTDTIQFSASINGQTIALTSELTISDPIVIQGNGTSKTLISGAATAAVNNRIFNVNITKGADLVTMSGMTLSGGNLTSGNGAAISFGNETLTLSNMRFINNVTASGTGGAISSSTASAVVSISNSEFAFNSASSTGGAINVSGTGTILTITNSTFRFNQAGSTGGAIHGATSLTINTTDSLFDNNFSSSDGGAISAITSGVGTFTRTTFTNNTGTNGGAIRMATTPTITIDNCLIASNFARTAGGGLFNTGTSSATVTITSSSFINNIANSSGGGAINVGLTDPLSLMKVINSTFSGNLARGTASTTGGGAINVGSTDFAGSLEIYNSTIVNNAATNTIAKGGAIFLNDSSTTTNTGTLLISSSIIAGNLTVQGRDISWNSPTIPLTRPITINESYIGSLDALYFAATTTGSFIGDETFALASPVQPLAYYGGSMPVHVLKAGTPAIDAGNDVLVITPSVDQRGTGFPRNVGAKTDMGAVEGFLNFPVATVTLADVKVGGSSNYVATVIYTDETGINTGTIDAGDVRLSGPGYGLPQAPSGFLVSGSGTKVTVTYTFPAPGTWDLADNGVYTLSLIAGQVLDVDGSPHAAAQGTVGQFRTDVASNVFVVDSTGDTIDGNYSAGQFTLREAIDLANKNLRSSTPDVISFNASLTGKTITVGSELLVTDPVRIVGLGAGNLTISGGNTTRIFNVNMPNTNVPFEVSDITLTAGSAAGDGGAILSQDEMIIVDRVNFASNKATVNGGAIGVALALAPVTISDSTFTLNTAVRGGAMNFAATASRGTFRNSTFTNNSATAGPGGAVAFTSTSVAEVVNSTFSGNTATTGGALYLSNTSAANVFATVTGSTFTNNVVTGTNEGGGAIRISQGQIRVYSSTFTGNQAVGAGGVSGNGGGISATSGPTSWIVDGSTFKNNTANNAGGAIISNTTNTAPLPNNVMQITNTTFDSNIATTGGAIYINGNNIVIAATTKFMNNKATANNTGGGAIRNGDGTIILDSCLFEGNEAVLWGGAIGDDGTPVHNMFISNSTFNKNSANQGGALYTDQGFITIDKSTFSNNTAKTGVGGAIGLPTGNAGTGIAVTNSTFTGNRAATTGGAFHIASTPSGSDTFTSFKSINTKFIDNRALGGAGGAVHMGRGTIVIDTTQFINNRSQGSGGGFSSTTGPNHFTITNSLFEGNQGLQDGGGLVAASTSDIVISNTVFRNNMTSRAGGGAFIQGAGSSFTATDVTFEGNTAGEGGAFGNDDRDSTVTFNRVTMSNNKARMGGAIGIGADTTAVSTAGFYVLQNTTLSGNEATSTAGGGGAISIHNTYWAGTLDIKNSTIFGNKAVNGGGIWGKAASDNVTINSSIIAGNSATNKGRDFNFVGAHTVTVDGVLIGSFDNSNAALTGTWNAALVGTDLSPVDPGLYGLANNGGPTKTHALRVGSKALDAGNDNFSLGVDQRGVTRTIPHDLGSFEGTLLVPIATFALANVPPASTDYIATVFYEDDIGINVGSVDVSDLKISGAAFGAPTSPYKVVTSGPATNLKAEYYFTPPGGWDITDNGIYTVSLVGTVDDGVNPVAAGNFGQFRVNFAKTLTVDNMIDEDDGIYTVGDLSLREAIKLANGVGEGSVDTITFAPAITGAMLITLGQMDITDSVVITGPGMSKLTLDAGLLSRHFEINGGRVIDVTMSGLSLVAGNTTFMRDGGAVRIYYANVAFTDMLFDNNKATEDGGGIYVLGSDLKVSLTDSRVTNNFAGTFGGGVGQHAANVLTVVRSTVSGNQANNSGGGIYFQYNGSLTMDRSTVSGNSAELVTPKRGGGGIYFYGIIENGPFSITNSTISGNKASKTGGGGIGAYYITGDILIQNTTITGNDALLQGGGIAFGKNIYSAGSLTLKNSIIAGNTIGGIDSGTGDIWADSATNVNADFNLIGINETVSNNITLVGAGNLAGPDVPGKIDAKLGPLQNNGGPTFTHELLAGSPAIDQGKLFGSAVDQRGISRPQDNPAIANAAGGDGTDIGAFEIAIAAPPTVANIAINAGALQRSMVTTIKVTFSENVTFPFGIAAAFDVSRYAKATPNGSGLLGSVSLDLVQMGSDVIITFKAGGTVGIDKAGSLEDGQYKLTIFADKVMGVAGTLDGDGDLSAEGSPTDDKVQSFHRLFGDGNGDGNVNSVDFAQFRTFFGVVGPIFDWDGSGNVNGTDFAEFRKRFGLNGYLP